MPRYYEMVGKEKFLIPGEVQKTSNGNFAQILGGIKVAEIPEEDVVVEFNGLEKAQEIARGLKNNV